VRKVVLVVEKLISVSWQTLNRHLTAPIEYRQQLTFNRWVRADIYIGTKLT